MDKRKRRLLYMLEGSGRKSRWISGAPPLSFRALAAGELENYRIYGNTVDGESVGDRTGNLFDCKTERIPSITADITSMSVNETLQTISITANNTDARVGRAVEPGADYAGDLGYKYPCEAGKYYYLSGSNDVFDKNFLTFFNDNNISLGFSRVTTTAIQAPNNATYFTIRFGVANSVSGQTYTDKLMITELSTFEPPSIYEPYGYKVPVTVSNGTDTLTTPIYLPEQISKVGDEADYIDYGEQKMHRIGADDIDVTLPALPVLPGTNVLSVGTAVQPSRVEVKGRIKAVGQETEPEPETAEAEQETAEPEQETAEAEQETAEAEQETAEPEPETAEAEQE